jgi:uncharacterized protein (TIGR04255 family)
MAEPTRVRPDEVVDADGGLPGDCRERFPLASVLETQVADVRPALPEFTDPPLVEAVLAVQFEPLPGLDVLQLGRLWDGFRQDYPKHSIHPPLGGQFETFEGRPVEQLFLHLGVDAPQLRCWFLSEDETELVQVQLDRLVLNWRRKPGNDGYPRYERIRDRLRQALEKLSEFVVREDLGVVSPNQCEVTYVNHLEGGRGWKTFADVGEVFPGLSAAWSSGFLPLPEDVRAALRFRIPGAGGGPPIGRLHATIEPLYRRDDGAPMLSFSLTARIRPQRSESPEALEALDLGRRWVVEGFASLTSERMHEIWGRCDV